VVEVLDQPTGPDLRRQRESRQITAVALAEAMCVNRSRISQIENTARVTSRLAARYMAALATFANEQTLRSPGGEA
jgi:transcriptional regulator with XRE-family HTH domain